MLNVGKIEEGFVLDHIKAGKSLSIYELLQLDKLDCPVAIIKNARSDKMGKKDILKVECNVDMLDLDVLAVHRPQHHSQCDPKRRNRLQKGACPSQTDQKCLKMPQPQMHHLYRARASSYLCPG